MTRIVHLLLLLALPILVACSAEQTQPADLGAPVVQVYYPPT